MTQPTANDALPPPSEPQRTARTEIAQARRSLLAELEASLETSQRALLARDVAGLEQSSGEQMRLLRALQIFWQPGLALDDPVHDAELRAMQMRVLHLGRVQAALLARGQRWLRTIAHLVAGPATNYVPSASPGVPLGRHHLPAAGKE
jgi:hypothetical protein